MKKNDFKKLSSALTKTARAFELCFDTATVEKAGVLYSLDEFKIDFEIYVEDLGIGTIKIKDQNDSADELIQSFVESLVQQIDSRLAGVKEKEDKYIKLWESHKIYSHEFSYVSSVIALEMIKEIIESMFSLRIAD